MHPTEALTTMSFANFLRQTDAVGIFVFCLLVLILIVRPTGLLGRPAAGRP